MLHRNIPFRKPQKPRKIVRCKGRLRGTSIKCGADLCETNGELLYVTFGRREMAMEPKRTDNPFLKCDECGHQTEWIKAK